jgi:LysR family transcriptional regulator, transcriptional activator of nhaA
MADLNYNHLWYFWTVAREGSIAAATGPLGVTQPAISSQLARLERALGTKLFEKSGRGLALTPDGTTVFAYADQIFTLGCEMLQTLGRGGERPLRLVVGVAEGMPPAITHRLLAPALALPQPVRLDLRHGPLTRLAGELAGRELDLVLCGERLAAGSAVRAQAHPLGSCCVVLLAAQALAARLAPGFPTSLDGAPFVLPPSAVPLRRVVDGWMRAACVSPAVLAEMDDWAASLLLAQSGAAVIALPCEMEAEQRERYGLAVVGVADGATQHFFALTTERRPSHPGVVAVLDAAREQPIE